MNIQYGITIHRYLDDKKRKNSIDFKVFFKPQKDKSTLREYYSCCDEMRDGVAYGHIGIAHNKYNFHTRYEEKQELLKEPILCLTAYTEPVDYDDGSEKEYLPIKFCPFCSKEITFELIEKKKITHTCKKVTKSYESCNDETEEEIVFSKKEATKN